MFAGRREELNTLHTALARADAGEPQALLLAGEAGVGKTRLLSEFLRSARESGAVTAVGGCVELGADGLPFAAFTMALRALQHELGGDALAAAVAGREAELARLLPGLGTPADDGAPADTAPHPREDRHRLFELTAQALERLAADRTLVLVLEDLHWADRSTRELLGYLYRSLQPSRLVLLASYRSDDIHRRHPLRPFLAELDRLRSVRRLELPRLSRDEVAAQVAGIRGGAEPALVERIYDRTDGNAFFVEELAADGDEACGISDSLRDLLLVRVERLPEEAARVVRTAAEGGETVEHALLAAVTGLPEDELLDGLRAAVGGSVLVAAECAAAPDAYTFRHSLLREAVRDDLLPGERARLNRRYAQALADDPGLVRPEQRLTRIAWHWHRGRDSARALPAKLAASVEARRRHAFAEQYELLEKALEAWEDVTEEVRAGLRPLDFAEVYPPLSDRPGAPVGYLDLLAETVVAARYADERERALRFAKRALREIDETADPLRAAWFWLQRGMVVDGLGRGDGWDEIDRAERLVRDLPPSPVTAEVLTTAAGWGMIYAPGRQSLERAEHAVKLATEVGATATALAARNKRAVLLAMTGDSEQGIAELRAVAEEARRTGDFPSAASAEHNLACELDAAGRSAEAVVSANRAARLADEEGRREMHAFALSNKLEALLALGRWDEVVRTADRARRRSATTKVSGAVAAGLTPLHLRRGEFELAERSLADARELLGYAVRQPQHALTLRGWAMGLAVARGDLETARAEAGAALEDECACVMHQYAWPVLCAAAPLAAGAPSFASALRAVAARLPRPYPLWEAHARWADAELAGAEGAADPAAWAAAVTAFEPLERPYELARTRHGWAEALLAADAGREQAAALLRAAHATACALGAAPLRDTIERLARRAGVVPTAEPSSPALTPRERDVLRLVAAGRSNRQIAEELYISPKTASVHVSNLLAKLGASTRGEAAALARRAGLVDAGQPGGAGDAG